MSELIPFQGSKALAPVLQKKRVRKMDVFGSLSENTKRTYLMDLSMFAHWMLDKEFIESEDGHKLHFDEKEIAEALKSFHVTPEVVIIWLQEHGFEYKLSTLSRKISSLNWGLKNLGLPVSSASPEVKETFKRLKKLHERYMHNDVLSAEIREKGFEPPGLEKTPKDYKKSPAKPLRLEHLFKIIDYLDSGDHSFGPNRIIRDKALISLMWFGLHRRSEIAQLRIEMLEFAKGGLFYELLSKTGITSKTIPYTDNEKYCPVRSVQDWLGRLGNPESGWLFVGVSKMDSIKKDRAVPISDRDVTRILTRNAIGAGLDISFSGHSPRRGAATDIYEIKRDSLAVKNAGGWKSNIFEDYIDKKSLEEFDNAGVKGLV